MTARFSSVLLLAALSCFSASCDFDPCGSTPASFLDRSQDFFQQVDAADHAVDSKDWQLYDERLKELVETCYPQHKKALSQEEDRVFWKGVGQFYVKRYGRAGARDLLRGLDKELDKLEDWLNRNL